MPERGKHGELVRSAQKPAAIVRVPCARCQAGIRPCKKGRAIHPTQHSPKRTAIVALWVAAAKAVKANVPETLVAVRVAIVKVPLPCGLESQGAEEFRL